MTDLDLIDDLPLNRLTKSEQIALEHFRKKPEGRGFFPVAEIMVRYDKRDDAIQCLMSGLELHPNYSVARVFLANLFFRKFFFREAWSWLEASPTSLRSNLTAQTLRLKLCVVLSLESQAQSLARELSSAEFEDAEARIIIEHINIKNFAVLRKDFADYLGWTGFYAPTKPVAKIASTPLQEAADIDLEQAQERFQGKVAKGFFSSPVQEIFIKTPVKESKTKELDELTRARLARRQGLYQSSFEIYERMAYASPGNELLRRELAEIRELRDTQREIDRRTDPRVADAMEKVRVIDRKIVTLQALLKILDSNGDRYS